MRNPEMVKEFEAWMKEIDAEVQSLAGLSVHDLPDIPFKSAFLDELSPIETIDFYADELGIQELI